MLANDSGRILLQATVFFVSVVILDFGDNPFDLGDLCDAAT